MTEADVNVMEAAVMAESTLTPEKELAWNEAQIKELTETAGTLEARWKLQRAMREDTMMTATYNDIVKVRAALTYLREQVTKLGG